jgi:glutamate 5-kinase
MDNISDKKRIVVKVGTSTLTHSTGMLNIRRIEQLIKVLSDLKNCGKEIILVTSGAIGVGCGKLGLQTRPSDTPSKQAIAAIGQCELMYLYDKQFAQYNHTVAQILMTKDIVLDDERKQNVINTFSKLLSIGAVPIINENDTVSVEEIEFGDNDTLSAVVADLVDADLLIILSDIDGLYNKDPHKHSNAKLIPVVEEIDDKIIALAEGAGSKHGTGGMITKIHAAQIANKAGIDMVIMNGQDANMLYDLFENKPVGTLFKATK